MSKPKSTVSSCTVEKRSRIKTTLLITVTNVFQAVLKAGEEMHVLRGEASAALVCVWRRRHTERVGGVE